MNSNNRLPEGTFPFSIGSASLKGSRASQTQSERASSVRPPRTMHPRSCSSKYKRSNRTDSLPRQDYSSKQLTGAEGARKKVTIAPSAVVGSSSASGSGLSQDKKEKEVLIDNKDKHEETQNNTPDTGKAGHQCSGQDNNSLYNENIYQICRNVFDDSDFISQLGAFGRQLDKTRSQVRENYSMLLSSIEQLQNNSDKSRLDRIYQDIKTPHPFLVIKS